MGDLIDLKSPDGKTATGPKLASPLIPAPTKLLNDEKIDANSTIPSSGLNFVKRNSLDNNPFDNALHKTVDYARKQDDPFEIVLEKALKYTDANIVLTPKARSVEFKDDFTPKRTRYSDILKINKTLDDSVIEAELSKARKISLSPCGDDSIIQDLNDTNLLCANDKKTKSEDNNELKLQNARIIPRISMEPPSPNDLSILDQSAMNDSLTESSGNSEESLIKSIVAKRISMCIQKGANDAKNLVIPSELSKSQKLRRSLSQSNNNASPQKFRQRRSQSIAGSLKVGLENDNENSICSVPSFIFEDNMNKAFLESRRINDNSMISDLSNISAITRLNSASSAYNSSYCSSGFSNRTANRAFIEHSINDPSSIMNSNEKSERKPSAAGSIASFESPSKKTPGNEDITDLLSKYSRLRVKSSELSTNDVSTTRLPSIVSGSGIVNFAADKLIDVDGSVEAGPPLERSQRQSISSSSSDSVFLDNNTIGRSIIAEARSLAKTFEELAARTSSSCGSNNSDLINTRPPWNFGLLPVSDDDALVDDLIDLPGSPIKCHISKVPNAEESATNKSSSSSSEPKSDKSIIKELETEFIEPEKKKIASSLLMELENLVKSEGNPEAIMLLENLEKALGVHCGSNSELLASCFGTRNNLTKSPKRSDNPLGNENIKDESNEKSCEDNIDVESSESLKQLSLSDDKSLQNNLNVAKEINKSDKSLVLVNEKYDKITNEKLSINEIIEDSSELHADSISAIKKENHITDDQKIAVEILVGLGKLLTGYNKDPMTANVLKNLGKVLNLAASNNCDLESVAKTSVKDSKRVDTPIKNRIATPPRKNASLSAFSRSTNRRSFESNVKSNTPSERVARRSVSGVQSPTSTILRPPIKPLSADKSKAHLKEVKKRFSSDPSGISDKKSFEHSTNNRKTAKDIPLKSTTDLAKREQPSSTVADAVKSKFRKKIDTDASSKRGPMKALLPLGNMQRQGKRLPSSTGSVTPPKPSREISSTCEVTTSTPFPDVHISGPSKSSRSKPMASSTPDGGAPKNARRSAPPIPQSPAKNSFTCNISPVTSKTDDADDNNSSKDNSKSKMLTPSKSRTVSQLPKLSPMLGIKSSLNKSPRGQRRSEPLQSFLPRSMNTPKSPTICVTEASTSPLNNSNKLGSKVKPLNLISKLRRRSASTTEKENYA